MISNGKMKKMDLRVNPYDFLGVSRGCSDMKLITKAYHQKSLQLHPDKRKQSDDFSTLNKCYVYLKTLVEELQKCQDSICSQEWKTRNLMSTPSNLNSTANSQSEFMQDNRNLEEKLHKLRKFRSLETTVHSNSTPNNSKPDFSQQIRKNNCIIGADKFDVNAVYQNMMRDRPASTRYHDIAPTSFSTGTPKRNLTFEQFNQQFTENMAVQQSQMENSHGPLKGVEGFTSFDEFDGAASVVSHGESLFVREPCNNDRAYGSLEQFSTYDRNLEQQRFADPKSLTGKVSDGEMRRFAQMLEQTTRPCK
jgi:hypothetical protein